MSILLYVGAALALIAALVGGYTLVDGHGYKRGVSEVTAQVAQRDNEQLTKTLAQLKVAQDRVRNLETKSQNDLAIISTNNKKEIANAVAKKDATIASLRDGTIKLQVQLAQSSTISAGSSPSSPSTPTGIRDAGTETGVLSEADGAFLVEEASRADQVVFQLKAAQEVITKDREVCK